MYLISESCIDPNMKGSDLLSGAAYFGLVPLCRRLLSKGCCPATKTPLFPAPMKTAALMGNTDVLELFQEYLPEYEDISGEYWSCGGKAGPESIYGAAIRGDMDVLKLCMYPHCSGNPSPHRDDEVLGQPYGQIDSESKAGATISRAKRMTNSLEMFKYFQNALRYTTPGELENDLLAAAAKGNLPIVRYLASQGVCAAPTCYSTTPLRRACMGWHEDVVDFMLVEAGVDPNEPGMDRPGPRPLGIAACIGSLTLVKKLLDHGAKAYDLEDPVGPTWLPLMYACAAEHSAIIRLLFEHGANRADYSYGGYVISMALHCELNSTTDILASYGVKASLKTPFELVDGPWINWSDPIGYLKSRRDRLQNDAELVHKILSEHYLR
ncbi:ankyrin repeat-containing domain protein [Xylariales sp. PMI_506]|nr:ankyrin repeat-containing domain protein [Xylariales sp. PMI_506]